MTTKRVKRAPARSGISQELIEAWQRGDRAAVRHLTGTKPWMISPLDATPSNRPSEETPYADSWPRALEWRKRLMMAAGKPGSSSADETQEDRAAGH